MHMFFVAKRCAFIFKGDIFCTSFEITKFLGVDYIPVCFDSISISEQVVETSKRLGLNQVLY